MNNFYTPFPRINPFAYSRPCKYKMWQPPNILHNNLADKNVKNPTDYTDSKNENIKKEDHPIVKKQPVVNILGFKFYEDDILILSLIYFLYKENIEDNLLLISLFSLLFS